MLASKLTEVNTCILCHLKEGLDGDTLTMAAEAGGILSFAFFSGFTLWAGARKKENPPGPGV